MKGLGKIAPKKSLGQHFLNNRGVPKRMVDAARVVSGETIVEIGPGTGVLTRELLERGGVVIAIETDLRAIESLTNDFASYLTSKQLTLMHKDIRTFSLHDLKLPEHSYKVVANIPYFLSGMLFRIFLETDMQPSDIVFLVQKEVAERIARDKKESLLSLSVKAYGKPKYVTTVRRGNFSPPPNVESAILLIENISHASFAKLREEEFFKLLHHGFASKRKQLLGNLSKVMDRAVLTHIFSTLGLALDVRGEDLSIESWLTLADAILSTDNPQSTQ